MNLLEYPDEILPRGASRGSPALRKRAVRFLLAGILLSVAFSCTGAQKVDGSQQWRLPGVERLSGSYLSVASSPTGEAVAVGQAGISVRATLASDWVAQPIDASEGWTRVVSNGAGSWVAVGRGVATRKAGETAWKRWTPGTHPNKASWRSDIAFGGGQWILIVDRQMYERADGDTEWKATGPQGFAADHVACDRDGTCAAAGGGSIVVRRPDSGAWDVVPNSVGIWQGAAVNDGHFLFFGRGRIGEKKRGEAQWTFSSRGERWTPTAVAFGAGAWAIAGSGWIVFRPKGDVSWHDVKGLDPESSWQSIGYGSKGEWVAVGSRGIAVGSDSSLDWKMVGKEPRGAWSGLSFEANGTWTIAGVAGLAQSIDAGATWKRVGSPWDGSWNAVVASDRQELVLGDGMLAIRGEDGRLLRTLTQGVSWRDAAHADGMWVAAGSAGIVTFNRDSGDLQPDGIGGDPIDDRERDQAVWKRVAPGAGRWVAAGPGLAVRIGNKGEWKRLADRAVLQSFQDLLFDAKERQWVAAGSKSLVIGQADAQSWSLAIEKITGAPITGVWESVANDGAGGWIAVGRGPIAIRAKGEQSWTLPGHAPTGWWKRVVRDEASRGWIVFDYSQEVAAASMDGLRWATVSLSGRKKVLLSPSYQMVRLDWHPQLVSTTPGQVFASPKSERGTGALYRVRPHKHTKVEFPVALATQSLPLTITPGEAWCERGETEIRVRAVESNGWDQGAKFKIVGKRSLEIGDQRTEVRIPVELEGPAGIGLSAGQTVVMFVELECTADGAETSIHPSLVSPAPIEYRPWFLLIPAAGRLCIAWIATSLLLIGGLYVWRPSALVAIHGWPRKLGRAADWAIPLTPLKLGDALHLTNAMLVPMLYRSKRTQRAWMARNISLARQHFPEEALVGRQDSYVALPLRWRQGEQDEVIHEPSAGRLAECLAARGRRVIEIVGPGGSGKTMLLVQLCRTLLMQESSLHREPAIPVLVDEDCVDLFVTVRRKLSALLRADVDDDFLRILLRSGMIVPAIDRLSERDAATVSALRTQAAPLALGLLLVSTRTQYQYEGMSKATLSPQPIAGPGLLSLVNGLIEARQAQDLFPALGDHTSLANQVANLVPVGSSPQVTPLLTRIFVDLAIGQRRRGEALDTLPIYAAQVYAKYLVDLNPKDSAAANFMSDEDMLRAARILASLSLARDRVPRKFARDDARARLKAAGFYEAGRADPVRRLVANGVLLEEALIVPQEWLRFTLDPVAEFLAAQEELKVWDQARGIDEWCEDVGHQFPAGVGFVLALRQVAQLSLASD